MALAVSYRKRSVFSSMNHLFPLSLSSRRLCGLHKTFSPSEKKEKQANKQTNKQKRRETIEDGRLDGSPLTSGGSRFDKSHGGSPLAILSPTELLCTGGGGVGVVVEGEEQGFDEIDRTSALIGPECPVGS